MFYKKDATFAEKGVGMLHLKKIKEDKTQLVVRADTSLGNILLNIMLPPKASDFQGASPAQPPAP